MLRASSWGRISVLLFFFLVTLLSAHTSVQSQSEDAEVIAIATVLDVDGNRVLGDREILEAVRLWIVGISPPTRNQSILDTQILGLIRLWITGALLPDGPSSPTLPPDDEEGPHEDDLPNGADAIIQSLSQSSSKLFKTFDNIRAIRSMFKNDLEDEIEDTFIPGLRAYHDSQQVLNDLISVCPAGPIRRADLMGFIETTEDIVDLVKKDFNATTQFQSAITSFNQALSMFLADNDPQALQFTCGANGGQMFMSQGLDGLADQLGLMASDFATQANDIVLDLQNSKTQFQDVTTAFKSLLQSDIPTTSALFEHLNGAADMIGSFLIGAALSDSMDEIGGVQQLFSVEDFDLPNLNPSEIMLKTENADDSFSDIFSQEGEFGWMLNGFQFYFCGGKYVTIIGTEGNDTLKGKTKDPIDGIGGTDNVDDVISGLGGDDNLTGLGGNDIICGGDGDDKIIGNAGNDLLYGGQGADQIDGSEGHDRIYGGPADDLILGGIGQDILFGEGSNDIIIAGNGLNSADFDMVFGGYGDDKLNGDDGVDWIDGGPGQDILEGNGHDDSMWGGDGEDILRGGPGNDTLEGDAAGGTVDLSFLHRDELYGDAGNDFLLGGYGGDLLVGGEGQDICNGGKAGGFPDTASTDCETVKNVP